MAIAALSRLLTGLLARLLALLTLLALLAALSLLALLTLLLAPLPLGLAQQLVLAPRHAVELVHHLAALLVALALLTLLLAALPALAGLGHHRHRVLHHLAQLFERALGAFAIAVLGHLANLVEHLLDVVAGDGAVRIHLLRLLHHAAAFFRILHLLVELFLPAVHRAVELLNQFLDLLVAGLALHGVAQILACLLELALGIVRGAVLQAHRQIPQDLLRIGDVFLVAALGQPPAAHAQAELDHRIVAVALGVVADHGHAVDHVGTQRLGIAGELLAQQDQRACRRVGEHALRQQEGLHRAAALLAERIGRKQHHRDLEAGPRRAGEVAHEGVGDLPGARRHRQVDAHDLGLVLVGQHVGAQHGAVQADLKLHAGHAKIVAGDVLDLGRPFVDADAAREFHCRREVRDHVQLPARLLVATGLERDLVARGDRLLDLVLALADGVELESLAVDVQLGRMTAARVVDEARDLRTDRHAQQLVVIGHVEIDRRLAGIGRRRDPEIGDDRRRRRKRRHERAHHAIAAPAARHHDGDDQRQHRHDAQRPGVDDRQDRLRWPVGQAGETLRFAAAMRLPQRRRHRIGAARSQLILNGDQRPVRHARVAFEPADRNIA